MWPVRLSGATLLGPRTLVASVGCVTDDDTFVAFQTEP